MKQNTLIGERLRLLRQARNLSLDELCAKLGGIISKQAISKYERNLSYPSPKVLTKVAQALGVKASSLWAEPRISVDFIAYRKGSGLSESEQNRIKSLVTEILEDWADLQELVEGEGAEIPIQSKNVQQVEDAENIANEFRQEWNLGIAPIANVVGMLEEHNIFVVEVKAEEKFDGISAIAQKEDKKVRAAAVVSRSGIPGERQRLNLLHELGHLLLNVPSNVDEEKAAFRFGAAVLAPQEAVYKEVGNSRSKITFDELMLLKKKFGISLQAIVYRLKDLGVINQSYYQTWFTYINQQGWKKHEPDEWIPEKPQWLRKNVLRAFAEKAITLDRAEHLLGEKLESDQNISLIRRKAFMQLPLLERRRILSEQARKYSSDYSPDNDWMEMQGGKDVFDE